VLSVTAGTLAVAGSLQQIYEKSSTKNTAAGAGCTGC
jgi:hypothetical protein